MLAIKNAGTHLLLTAVWPLLGDDADPLVTKHANAEDGDAAAVDELHRLHRQYRRDQIVRVVFTTSDRHEAVTRTTHEHQTTLRHNTTAVSRDLYVLM